MKHSHCLICSKAGSLQTIKSEDRSPSIHSDGETNIVRGFLVSSKSNQANWKTSIEATKSLAAQAMNHDFMIAPQLINTPLSKGGGGHYFGSDTYDDLIQGYSNHSHGKIIRVDGPYNYNDGTNDIFYMCNIKLRDSKAASALLEQGPKLWTPFAVSPHIYPRAYNDKGEVTQADFVGVALVIKGAYGDEAVITKHCTGEEGYCMKSLSASICCNNEDSLAAQTINGLVMNGPNSSEILQKATDKLLMSKQLLDEPKNKEAPLDEEQEIESKPAKGTTNISIKELEALKLDAENGKKNKEQLDNLVTKDKTSTLNSIFSVVEDGDTKKSLFDKYFKEDTDRLHSFVKDYEKHVLPIKIKEAVEAAKKDTKKDEKNDSRSASVLRPEPRSENENEDSSKAGSIVHKNDNAVVDFDRFMRGNI